MKTKRRWRSPAGDTVTAFLSRNGWPLWPCGHERTEANTVSVGGGGFRCRECRRAIHSKHNCGNRKVNAWEREQLNG